MQAQGDAPDRNRLPLLALYVAGQSAYVLEAGIKPHHSPLGIAWLGLSGVAMFALAHVGGDRRSPVHVLRRTDRARNGSISPVRSSG